MDINAPHFYNLGRAVGCESRELCHGHDGHDNVYVKIILVGVQFDLCG